MFIFFLFRVFSNRKRPKSIALAEPQSAWPLELTDREGCDDRQRQKSFSWRSFKQPRGETAARATAERSAVLDASPTVESKSLSRDSDPHRTPHVAEPESSRIRGQRRSQHTITNTPSHILTVIVLAIFLYVNSLNGDFTFDDHLAWVNNEDTKASSNLTDLLYHDFWGQPLTSDSSHKSYRPITILAYRLTRQVSEAVMGKLHPFFYHIQNVLLHALSSVLVYFIALSTFQPQLCTHCELPSSSSTSSRSDASHAESLHGVPGRLAVCSASDPHGECQLGSWICRPFISMLVLWLFPPVVSYPLVSSKRTVWHQGARPSSDVWCRFLSCLFVRSALERNYSDCPMSNRSV